MIYKSLFNNINQNIIGVLIADEETTNAQLTQYLDFTVNEYYESLREHTDFFDVFSTTEAGTENVLLAEDPVTIKLNSADGVMSYIKTLSCTVRLVANTMIPSLYTPQNQGVKCYVYNYTDDDYLFFGYATPCIYNQEWARTYDDLELEFISPIATLKNVSYQFTQNTGPSIQACGKIIGNCLAKTNYYQYYDFPNIYTLDDDESKADIPINMYLNELVYKEKDKDKENWDCYQVLEEFCKFMGLTLIEWGNSNRVGFFDMYANSKQYETGASSVKYKRYNLNGTIQSTNITHIKSVNVINELIVTDETDLSLDDTYNKITIKTDLKEPDALIDIFKPEDGATPYYEDTINEGDPQYDIVDGIVDEFGSNSELYAIYKGMWCMIVKNTEGGSSINEWIWVRNWHNTEHSKQYWYVKPSTSSGYPSSGIDEPTGTFGLDPTQIMTYNGAYILENGNDPVKYGNNKYMAVNKVSLSKYIILGCHRPAAHNVYTAPDVYGNTPRNDKISLDGIRPRIPLYEYRDTFNYNTSKNKYIVINFSAIYSNKNKRPFVYKDMCKNDDDETHPLTRFIWISLKVGDYWLSRNTADHNYVCAFTGNTTGENTTVPEDQTALSYTTYTWSDNGYVEPNQQLQPTNCKLYYKNLGNGKRYLGQTLSLITNIDWRMGIQSSEGVAFKLPAGVKAGDEIVLTIYTPHSLDEDNASEYVFIKNFTVKIEEGTFDNFEIDDDDEIIYTNVENEEYPNKLEDIETKIHTQPKDSPESYASIVKTDGDNILYIENITNEYIGEKQLQEYNVIDEVYEAYKEPKTILSTVIKGADIKPWTDYTVAMNLNKEMMVDNWEANIRQHETKVTLREK